MITPYIVKKPSNIVRRLCRQFIQLYKLAAPYPLTAGDLITTYKGTLLMTYTQALIMQLSKQAAYTVLPGDNPWKI